MLIKSEARHVYGVSSNRVENTILRDRLTVPADHRDLGPQYGTGVSTYA